jgi:hypothetical protein
MNKIHIRSGVLGALVAGLGIVALAGPAHAIEPQPDPEDVATPTCPPPPADGSGPQYKVKMLKFTADDESNLDVAGSDEPYFVFSSVGTDGTSATRRSATFGDVDSGDTRPFGSADYMWGTKCHGKTAPMGIGYSVELFEHDLGSSEDTRKKVAQYFGYAGDIADYIGKQYPAAAWVGPAVKVVGQGVDLILDWGKDDLIGSTTAAFAPSELASRLPSNGSSFTKSIYLGGAETSGGADYTLQLQVTRTR